MCGIAGKVVLRGAGAPPSRELLSAMAASLHHRGPDAYGRYLDDHAGLAHARLSLVDLLTGQQPMTTGSGDWWIVFNGEIYNYVELRAELAGLGRTFRTTSDTEVIVHAFEQWGTACFERFNGQWALALWSAKHHELVLARDPIGICPLYVREHAGTVWFASEVKAIFTDPAVPRAIDPHAIDQLFSTWAPRAPTSAFAGIHELPPGTHRTYRTDPLPIDGVTWTPDFGDVDTTTSFADAAASLRERLSVATSHRLLRADVPVGCYLSGGLDSSVVARLGSLASGGTLETFSLRFADAEFDETEHQQRMVDELGSRHHDIVVSQADIAASFPDVIAHTERPVLRTAPAPLFALSELVRAHGIKAVLTGEGADEMLAGYDLFREAKIREFWARRPESTVRPLLFDRIYPYLQRTPASARSMAWAFWRKGLEDAGKPGFSHGPRWSSASALKRLFAKDLAAGLRDDPSADPLASLPATFSSWSTLHQAQYLEITTLLSPYLISSQGDRMLMAHSVEGRFPFLDREVVDLCMRLPASYTLPALDEKHILKHVAGDLVPPSIIRRKKQPYRAPDAICFVGGDAPGYVDEVLSPAAVRAAGLFDDAAVTALLRKCRAAAARGPESLGNSDNMALVGVLSSQLLYHQFVATTPTSAASPAVSFETDVVVTS